MSEKCFAQTMLSVVRGLPPFSGTGSHLWKRDRQGFEIKEIHHSYPWNSGKFFLADILYVQKRGSKIVFTNGVF